VGEEIKNVEERRRETTTVSVLEARRSPHMKIGNRTQRDAKKGVKEFKARIPRQ
jgi:hypothetical protein